MAAPTANWHRYDLRKDRAAGAWMGAAAAACMVGSPPAMAAELTHPDGDGAGPALLAWLIQTALHGIRAPQQITQTVHTRTARAWTGALRQAVAQGTIAPVHDHPPAQDPLTLSWHAAAHTPVPGLDPARGLFPCAQLVDAVWEAYTAGGDEAAMYTGALAGARWGASAIPLQAQRRLCDITAPGALATRAVTAARGSDPGSWPEKGLLHQQTPPAPAFATPHPHDPGVVLANVHHLRSHPPVQAVVSLCRMGAHEAPAFVPPADWVQVWLVDREGANPNLHFVLDQAAEAIAALRAEGKHVLVHCAAAASRTPAVAAHYAALTCGVDVVQALRQTITALGGHLRTPSLARAVAQLNGVELTDPHSQLFPHGPPPPRRLR